MLDLFIPLFCILLGVIGLALYVVVQALREATRRIVQMNEQLMLLVSTKDGDPTAGRMLLASAKSPKKVVPGLSKPKEKPKDDKPPYKLTIGSL